MGIDALVRDFKNPGAKYRFAPFWFLNHDLSDEELVWQIREMHGMGVDGFILHPRHGLLTPYLSEEWMDRIGTCIAEAKRLGMVAYLYDENNWPSGPADGLVIEENPSYRMSGCYLAQTFDVRPGAKATKKLDVGDGLIAIVAAPMREGEFAGAPQSFLNLAESVEGDRLAWSAPIEGNVVALDSWRVMVFARRFLVGMFFGGYLDTLNKDAVRRFIEVTHAAYARRFWDSFGATVDGIFTDEPSMNYNALDCVNWTGSLPNEFEWRTGYELWRALPALFFDVGDASPRMRCEFYAVSTRMFRDAFFKQIYHACDRMRLKAIGHVNCEGELSPHVRHLGDIFELTRYMHYAGCDFLCEQIWPAEEATHRLNNLLGPKLASSAGHQLEKDRVMSECFGLASQWAIDLRNLKWMTDWQVAMGINLLEPHAFYYSVQGFRKWECPPGEFYQSPFWPYYRTLADYAGRLCSLFSGGEHMADAALLYPIKSLQANVLPPKPYDTPEQRKLVDGFDRVSEALVRAHFDYDIVTEEMVCAGLLGDCVTLFGPSGRVTEEFHVLVVPPLDCISEETLAALELFVDSGGKLVAVGYLPEASTERGRDPEVFQRMCNLFDAEPQYAQRHLGARMAKRIYSKVHEGRGTAVFLAGYSDAPVKEIEHALMEEMPKLVNPDVTIADKDPKNDAARDVVHLHYRKSGADIFFFVNTSRERPADLYVSAHGHGTPFELSPATGNAREFTIAADRGGRRRFPLALQPTESRVVCFGEQPPEGLLPERVRRPRKQIAVLDDSWEFHTAKPNALPLNRWTIEIVPSIASKDWADMRYTYRAQFVCESKPADARLLLDGIAVEKVWRRSASLNYKVLVNGKAIPGFERGEYIDHHILEAPIAKMLRRGRNTVEIRTSCDLGEAGHLAHPVIIVGSFALERREQEWICVAAPGTIKTGSWTGQGYPFYSGIGVYRQTVTLAKPTRKQQIILELDRPGDMAEILVNGKSAAVRAWEPFEADITDLVREGANRIEIRVANSLQNLFVMEPKPSGILGQVRLLAEPA
jgi:hypothetical protein